MKYASKTQSLTLTTALLDEIILLAKRAGEAILEIYQTEFEVIKKSDQSPLTLADLAANDVIIRGLSALTPTIPILSEETALMDFNLRKTWPCYWLIDPLDGTREFVKRNGEFTVNIALIQNNIPVLGVVYAPVSDALFFAMHRQGAFKQAYFANGHYQALPLSNITQATHGVYEKALTKSPTAIQTKPLDLKRPIVAGSRSNIDTNMQRFMHQLKEQLGTQPELISMGSSLKICMIAEGVADVYPRLGLTSEWDTAAAHCILKEAGGEIVDITGNNLSYNTKADILNPHFFAISENDPATWHNWAQYL